MIRSESLALHALLFLFIFLNPVYCSHLCCNSRIKRSSPQIKLSSKLKQITVMPADLRCKGRFQPMGPSRSSCAGIHISLVFGVNINITVVIGDTVELPCNTILNESRNNPRISMQTHRHHVVHSFSSGKDDPAYQHPQFKNRTKIIYWPKLAIKLSNVSFTDEGAYICNIQEKRNDEYETTHSFEFNLYPTELYYSPTITTACKDKAKCGAEVNLICSSSHGYPESTVEWKNETGNIVLEGAITNFDCDPVNHQCNFTSVLKITVTTKVKIICSVLNLSLQDNRRLAEIILGSDIANPQKNNKKGLVIGMVAITVMLVVTCLGIIIWRSRSTSYTISEQEQQEQHFNLQSVPHPE